MRTITLALTGTVAVGTSQSERRMVRAPRPDQHAKITPEPDGRKSGCARVDPSRTRPYQRESFPRDRVDDVRLEAAMLGAKLGGNALMKASQHDDIVVLFFRIGVCMFPEIFIAWIESQRVQLEARAIRVEGPFPNPDWDDSSRLHSVFTLFELANYFAGITVWRAGHCDLEAIEGTTEATTHESLVLTSNGEHPFPDDWRRLVLIQKPDDFAQVFDPFFLPLLETAIIGEQQ